MTTMTSDPPLSKNLHIPNSMQAASIRLSERNIYTLIMSYRWLSFIPPIIAVTTNMHTVTALSMISFGLALVWLLWRTYAWLEQRTQPLPWIMIDLVLCAVLVGANGIWSSPYYLYALGPIFEVAFFYGLTLALEASLTLSISYGLTLAASLLINGQGGSWLVSVTNITGFILSGGLFGYQSEVSRQLKNQTALLDNYRQKLEHSHADLERIYQFNQVIGTSSNSEKVYELATAQFLAIEGVSKVTIARLNRPASSEKSRYVTQWFGTEPDTAGKQQLLSFLGQPKTYSNHQYFLPIGTSSGPTKGTPETSQAILIAEVEDTQVIYLLTVLADQLDRTLRTLEATRSLATHTERVRLAMDMHDTVVQALFGLGYSLDACARMLTTQQSNTSISQKLAELSTSTFDILARLRTIINDLWGSENQNGTATQLTVSSLITLLQLHIDSLAKVYPCPIQFSQTISQPEMALTSPSVKAVQHATQEALANALKHAQSQAITLSLAQIDHQLVIKVKDDGRGFITSEIDRQTTHLGLFTMQQRIEEAGGVFLLESAPGSGTTVTFRLPLTSNEDFEL